MTNHVTNILTAPSEVLDFMRGEPRDDGTVSMCDFDNLIRMPADLKNALCEVTAVAFSTMVVQGLPSIWPSSIVQKPIKGVPGDIKLTATAEDDVLHTLELLGALDYLRDGARKAFPDARMFENFIHLQRNLYQYGYATWNEWAYAKWGTKWNAYHTSRSDNAVTFMTAWTPPHPVIVKLAEQFPSVKLIHRWAYEDIGHNCGCRVYEGGAVQEIDIADPVDFALMLTDIGREDYWENPETGKWEYRVEEGFDVS